MNNELKGIGKRKGDKRKMNCNDCCYNLPKDGYSYCTYEDGECIKISMLEKENAELKRKFNAGNISFEEWLIYCKEQGLNLATQEMEQEEIDEMLEDCWIASRYNSDATSLCLKQSIQLTKAKELIERLLITPRTIYRKDEDGELSSFFNPAYEEIKQQAENFLKESEVEK